MSEVNEVVVSGADSAIAKRDVAGDIVSKMQDEWGKVLPSICTPERFARMALSCVRKNAVLGEAIQTPQGKISVLDAFMKCAELGIEPDGRRAHLIPYKNTKTGGFTITLIIDYKGIAELVMRSGLVSYIHADKVCENDVFECNKGKIEVHKPNYKMPRGKAYAYYALVVLKDGTEKSEIMTVDEVEAIRGRSRSANNGPWVTDFDEMSKKGLSIDTPIPTPDGWKVMGDMVDGDIVFDMDGKQVKVIAVSEIKNIECFKVTFSNNSTVICDNEHRWVAELGSSAARRVKEKGWRTFTINELYDAKNKNIAISIPVAMPIDVQEKNLLIDPWLLGFWLGDGTADKAGLSVNGDDLEDVIKNIGKTKYTLGKIRKYEDENCNNVGIKDGLLDDLRSLNLIKNKHIPQEYMRSSVSQRIALVQGLMDSDGCIEKERGRAIFSTTDKAMYNTMIELVSSLGEVVHHACRKQKGFGLIVDAYSVSWFPSKFNPVTVSRKAKNLKGRKLKAYRSIKSIEKIDSVPTKCIAVDSPTQTYLFGKCMIPTHNTTFKRLAKWLPLSPEVKTAIEEDDKDYIDVVTIPEKRSKFETQKAGNALLSVVKEDAVIEEPLAVKSETVVNPEQSEISKAIAGNYAGVTVEQFKAYMGEAGYTLRDAIANKDNIIGILADKIPL